MTSLIFINKKYNNIGNSANLVASVICLSDKRLDFLCRAVTVPKRDKIALAWEEVVINADKSYHHYQCRSRNCLHFRPLILYLPNFRLPVFLHHHLLHRYHHCHRRHCFRHFRVYYRTSYSYKGQCILCRVQSTDNCWYCNFLFNKRMKPCLGRSLEQVFSTSGLRSMCHLL